MIRLNEFRQEFNAGHYDSPEDQALFDLSSKFKYLIGESHSNRQALKDTILAMKNILFKWHHHEISLDVKTSEQASIITALNQDIMIERARGGDSGLFIVYSGFEEGPNG